MEYIEDYEIPNGEILGYNDKFPIISCVRVQYGESRTALLMFKCPFCGLEHSHGACENDKPGCGDGHRTAHCPIETNENEYGYYIKEVDFVKVSSIKEHSFRRVWNKFYKMSDEEKRNYKAPWRQ